MPRHTALTMVEIVNGLRNMAEMSWSFYSELKEQGFSSKEALSLTDTWLMAITTVSGNNADSDED